MSIFLQQALPKGEEAVETSVWFGSGWPLFAVIGIVILVGGTFWYRRRGRRK